MGFVTSNSSLMQWLSDTDSIHTFPFPLAEAAAVATFVGMEVQRRDYSEVDSLEKAQALFHAGKLERTFLFPLEFGGQEIPQNTLYVPLGIAAIKKRIDSMIQDLVNQGQVSSYTAQPEYKGKSFIPSKIKITASNPGKPGGLNPVIDIW